MNNGKSWKFDAKCEKGKKYLVRGDRPPLKIKIKQMGKLVVKSVRLNWDLSPVFLHNFKNRNYQYKHFDQKFSEKCYGFFFLKIFIKIVFHSSYVFCGLPKKAWTFIPPYRVKFFLNWILQAFLFTQIGNFKFRKIIQYSPKGGFDCTLNFANEIHLLMISFCKFEMLGFLQS